PKLAMPPPASEAELSDRVLWLTASVPLLKMPPPLMAELPARVLLVVVKVPRLKMAPPSWAESPERVLWLTVSVPKLAMPPPRPAESPDRVLWLTVSVPALKMPPPWSLMPLVMVRPDSVTAAELLVMSNTRLTLLPLICTGLAAGLSMSRLLLMANS